MDDKKPRKRRRKVKQQMTKKQKKKVSLFKMIALEDRLVFDAAGLVSLFDAPDADDGADVSPSDWQSAAEQSGADEQTEALLEAAAGQVENSDPAYLPLLTDQQNAQGKDARFQIIFLDMRADANDYLQTALEHTNAKLILIDEAENGVEKISSTLGEYSNVDAVHIISHGAEGQLQLGNMTLTQEGLREYAVQIKGWGDSLHEDADILIYGCDVGGGADGLMFLQQLSIDTGADILASDDATGDHEYGGDVDFEIEIGEVEALAVISEADAARMDSVLTKTSVPTDDNHNSESWSSGDDFEIIVDAGDGENHNMGGGNDMLIITGNINGNASANGDSGSDALYFDRNYSEFTVNNFTNNNGLLAAQIIDNETGKTLTVNNMEAIGFKDGTILGDDSDERLTEDYINEALGRGGSDLSISENNEIGVFEGGSVTITTDYLNTSGSSQAKASQVFTITSAPSTGHLKLNGQVLSQGSTFTQADLENDLVTYLHDGDEVHSDSFSFSFSDGEADALTGTFEIAVTAINDAPVLTVPDDVETDRDESVVITGLSIADDDLNGESASYDGLDTSKEKNNNGHGNNEDGVDDDNPGQGGGGPNSEKDDDGDEDEGQIGNHGDDTPGASPNGKSSSSADDDWGSESWSSDDDVEIIVDAGDGENHNMGGGDDMLIITGNINGNPLQTVIAVVMCSILIVTTVNSRSITSPIITACLPRRLLTMRQVKR